VKLLFEIPERPIWLCAWTFHGDQVAYPNIMVGNTILKHASLYLCGIAIDEGLFKKLQRRRVIHQLMISGKRSTALVGDDGIRVCLSNG
jgi:succinate-semialdehyde dehydrogenase/glutarate-semialdehyde dehydrogenase